MNIKNVKDTIILLQEYNLQDIYIIRICIYMLNIYFNHLVYIYKNKINDDFLKKEDLNEYLFNDKLNIKYMYNVFLSKPVVNIQTIIQNMESAIQTI